MRRSVGRMCVRPCIVCIWRLPIRMGMCSVEVWLVLGAGAGDHIWENEVMHRHASDVWRCCKMFREGPNFLYSMRLLLTQICYFIGNQPSTSIFLFQMYLNESDWLQFITPNSIAKHGWHVWLCTVSPLLPTLLLLTRGSHSFITPQVPAIRHTRHCHLSPWSHPHSGGPQQRPIVNCIQQQRRRSPFAVLVGHTR